MYKHTRLDRVISHFRVYYKFSDIIMNSNSPSAIDYEGNVYVGDKNFYSNGDYIIDWLYIDADGVIQ